MDVIVSLVLFFPPVPAVRPRVACMDDHRHAHPRIGAHFVVSPNLTTRDKFSASHTFSFLRVRRDSRRAWRIRGCWFPQASTFLLAIFVIDAALAVGAGRPQKGVPAEQYHCILCRGSLAQAVLVFWGVISMPITFSFFSLGS